MVRGFSDHPALWRTPHWGARADARARILPCLAVLVALAVPGRAATAPPPAGTVIENTARSAHVSPDGQPVEDNSNTATTMIATPCTLDPFLLSVAPTGPVVPGTLLTYTLSAKNRSGADLPGVDR